MTLPRHYLTVDREKVQFNALDIGEGENIQDVGRRTTDTTRPKGAAAQWQNNLRA